MLTDEERDFLLRSAAKHWGQVEAIKWVLHIAITIMSREPELHDLMLEMLQGIREIQERTFAEYGGPIDLGRAAGPEGLLNEDTRVKLMDEMKRSHDEFLVSYIDVLHKLEASTGNGDPQPDG